MTFVQQQGYITFDGTIFVMFNTYFIKVIAVAYVKIMSVNSLGGTDKNHENPQLSKVLVSIAYNAHEKIQKLCRN